MYVKKTNRVRGRLSEWIRSNNYSRKGVAELLGASLSFLSKIDAGKEMAPPAISQMIFVLTEGAIYFTPKRKGWHGY